MYERMAFCLQLHILENPFKKNTATFYLPVYHKYFLDFVTHLTSH